jgi:RNA polymerase sigma-70 factor (ECF subfamily)
MTAPIETRARARPATAPGAERPDLSESSDSRVVAAYLAGRDRAFDELVDRYQKRLLNFIYRTIGDRERAEDLVQEVFIRVFQTIKKNWEADHRPLQFEDPGHRPEDLYRKRQLRELVEASVAQLPKHHRVVFVLRELEGKSYEEIAEITKCNLGTVKSRLNRARNRFAQIIGPQLD